MINSNRIEYIDLAKGLCIILVVLNHVAEYMQIDYIFSCQIRSFRMPLYFILSGLFFKRYKSFKEFTLKKINKLLIPFFFFFLFTSILPATIHHKSTLFSEFYYFFLNGPIYNYAIWFLLCLFETNLFFYILFLFSECITKKHSDLMTIILTLVIGLFGILLSVLHIKTPLYLATVCTVLPFFGFGWWLKHHTTFLQSPFLVKRDIPLIVFYIIIVLLFAAPVDYSTNTISHKAIYTAHICGIAGTLFVLIIAKFIKYCPFISYWGRYSIMILCSHLLFISFLSIVIVSFNLPPILSFIITFALTMVLCHLTIPFMRRFLPYVTAQKDVIKIK